MPPRVQCPKCASSGDTNAVRTFVFSQAGQCDQCGACAMWTCRRCNAHFCPLCFPLPQSARSGETSTRSDRVSVDVHQRSADTESLAHSSDHNATHAPGHQEHYKKTQARAHGRAEDTQPHDAQRDRPAGNAGQQHRFQAHSAANNSHATGVYVHQPLHDAYYQQLPSQNTNNGPHGRHQQYFFPQRTMTNVEHLYRQPLTPSKSAGALGTSGAAHFPAQGIEGHPPGSLGADREQNARGNQGGAIGAIPPAHREVSAQPHLQYQSPELAPVRNDQHGFGEYEQRANQHESALPELYRGKQQPQLQRHWHQREDQEQQQEHQTQRADPEKHLHQNQHQQQHEPQQGERARQEQTRRQQQQHLYERDMSSHCDDSYQGSTVEQPVVLVRTTPRGGPNASASRTPPRASTHLQTPRLTTPSDIASTPAGHWGRIHASPRDATAAPSGRRDVLALKRSGPLNLTDCETSDALSENTPYCHFHREPMNYFCFQCSKESVTFCCADCIALGPHLGHDAMKLSQAVARARDTAIEYLANIRSKMAEAASKYKLVRTREHEASQLCDAATCQIEVRVAELKMRLDDMSSSLSKRCRAIFTTFGESNSKDERVFKSEKRRLELESNEWAEVGECLKGDMRTGLEVFSHAYSKSATKDVPSLKGSDALEELDVSLGSVLQEALALDIRPPGDDEGTSLRAQVQKLEEQLAAARGAETAEHDALRARVQELEQEGDKLRSAAVEDTERSVTEWQEACAKRGWLFRRCAHDEYLIGPPANLQKVRVGIETVLRGRVGGKTMSLSQCVEMLEQRQSTPMQHARQQHPKLHDAAERTTMTRHDTAPHHAHGHPDMHFAEHGAGGDVRPLPRDEGGVLFTEHRVAAGAQPLSPHGTFVSADARNVVAEGRSTTPTCSWRKTLPRQQFTELQGAPSVSSNSEGARNDNTNVCTGPHTSSAANDGGYSTGWRKPRLGSSTTGVTQDEDYNFDTHSTRRGEFHDPWHESMKNTGAPEKQGLAVSHNAHNDFHAWRTRERTMNDVRSDGDGAEKADDVVEQDDASNASVRERLRMLNKKLRVHLDSEAVEGENLGVSGGRDGTDKRSAFQDDMSGVGQPQPQQHQQEGDRQRQPQERGRQTEHERDRQQQEEWNRQQRQQEQYRQQQQQQERDLQQQEEWNRQQQQQWDRKQQQERDRQEQEEWNRQQQQERDRKQQQERDRQQQEEWNRQQQQERDRKQQQERDRQQQEEWNRRHQQERDRKQQQERDRQQQEEWNRQQQQERDRKQQQERDRQEQHERVEHRTTYAEHVAERKKSKQGAKTTSKGKRHKKGHDRTNVMTTAEKEGGMSAGTHKADAPTHGAAKERLKEEHLVSANMRAWETLTYDSARHTRADELARSDNAHKWDTSKHDVERYYSNDTDTTRSEGSIPGKARSQSTTTTDKESESGAGWRVLDLKKDSERLTSGTGEKRDETHEDELFWQGSGALSEFEQDDESCAVSHNNVAKISEKWDELLCAYPQYEKLLLKKHGHGRTAYFFGQHELDLRLRNGVLSVIVGTDVISATEFLTRFGGFQNARTQDGLKDSDSKKSSSQERQKKRGTSSRTPRGVNDLRRSDKKFPDTTSRSPREENGVNGSANTHAGTSARSCWPRRDLI